MEQGYISNSNNVRRAGRSNPLDVSRTTTDPFFLGFLVVIFFSWLSLVIYVLASARGQEIPPEASLIDSKIQLIPRYKEYLQNQNIVEAFFVPRTSALAGVCIFFGIICIIFYLRILRFHSQTCTRAGVVFVILSIIYHAIAIYTIASVQLPEDADAYSKKTSPIIQSVVNIVYLLVALICLLGPAKLRHIAEATENLYGVLFSFLRLIFFGICLSAVLTVPMYITVRAFLATTADERAISGAIIMTSMYLISFINSYAKAIVSLLTAVWHSLEDKKDVPPNLLTKCASKVTRYHLGTVAYDATIIFPMIAQALAAFQIKLNPKGSFFQAFVNFFLVLFMIFWNKDYPIAASAIHGKGFYESSKLALRSLTKNSALSYSFHFIYSCAVGFVTCFMMLVSSSPYIIWVFNNNDINIANLQDVLSSSYVLFSMVLTPILVITDCILNANLLCMMDNDDFKDETVPLSSGGKTYA